MRIMIIGATGFIGRALLEELEQAGHHILAVSRNKLRAESILDSRVKIVEWDGHSRTGLARYIAGIDAVINLTGDNIASGRWTKKRKKQIISSRVRTSRQIAENIRFAPEKPEIFIQSSAIGFYGNPVDQATDESGHQGEGFMADLTYEWESSVKSLHREIPRVVFLRTGLVLGKDGGILEKMMEPFAFHSGAIFGSGKQWMSWIHIHDQVRAIRFLLENDDCSGHYNLTAPNAVNMETFLKTIGAIIKKPVRFRIPGFMLRLALGEMAKETVLASQNIYPGRLLEEGFRFDFDQIEPALKNLLND